MRTIITTASIAAALAVAMVRGVASAQDVSDMAYDIADALNLDLFATQAFMAVAEPDTMSADAASAGLVADVSTPATETSTYAYVLPERIPVQVYTLPPVAASAVAPVVATAVLPAPKSASSAALVAQAAPLAGASSPLVSLNELSAISAGAEQVDSVLNINNQTINGLASGNSINAGGNIVNGSVNFSADALSNFAGIGNFVINTGNNNVLQGTLSVQVLTAPPNIVLH